MEVPAVAVRVVRRDPLRHGPVHLGLVDAGLAVVDHDEQLSAIFRVVRHHGRRLLEEAPDRHELPDVGDVLVARGVEDHRMAVANHLQVFISVILILGAALVALVCDLLKRTNAQLREMAADNIRGANALKFRSYCNRDQLRLRRSRHSV